MAVALGDVARLSAFRDLGTLLWNNGMLFLMERPRGDFGMATKPTRQQQQACDQLAEALLLIIEAARLDGRVKLDPESVSGITGKLAAMSSAFGVDDIVGRALQRRCQRLGLPESDVELLTLMESELDPLAILVLSDDAVRHRVARLREELGEV